MSTKYLSLPLFSDSRKRKKLFWLMIILMVSLIVTLRISAKTHDDLQERQAHPIEAYQVKMQDSYNRMRSFTGRITSAQVSMLGFELSGSIDTIKADDGKAVKKGDALAMLDTARLTAQKSQLLAKADEISANLTLAQNTYDRSVDLHGKGHISDQRLDDVKSNLARVIASEKANNASIEAVQVELEKSTLRAPFDGMITRRLKDEGTVIAAGEPLFEIVADGVIEAKIGVSPQVAADLLNGANYRIIDDLRRPIKGEISSVVSALRAKTRTQMVTFLLDDDIAQDGALATVLVENAVPLRGAWIPTRAMSADVRGLWRVYKVVDDRGDKRVRFENVQVLHAEGDKVYVSGSISDGDLLVAGGVDRLALNQVITVVKTINE